MLHMLSLFICMPISIAIVVCNFEFEVKVILITIISLFSHMSIKVYFVVE